MQRCKYFYRKNGDVSLRCSLLLGKGVENNFCAHQYLCLVTRRWEVDKTFSDCELYRQAQETHETPKGDNN